jgi:ribosomal protein L24E
MPKCSYCGKMYEFPRGLTFVDKEGHVKYLCSAKCRKNRAMKRRKINWISKAIKSKEELKEEIKESTE